MRAVVFEAAIFADPRARGFVVPGGARFFAVRFFAATFFDEIFFDEIFFDEIFFDEIFFATRLFGAPVFAALLLAAFFRAALFFAALLLGASFATAMLSTRLGYGRPAEAARALARCFCAGVSVVRDARFSGLRFFQGAFFAVAMAQACASMRSMRRTSASAQRLPGSPPHSSQAM